MKKLSKMRNKRTYNVKAAEERNQMELKKLAEKNEKARQLEQRKMELEIERQVKQQSASSAQALSTHYQNQIELVRRQLESVKFENYIAETAQKEQISKMRQDMGSKIKQI